jgi:hypothetical protein
MSLLTQATSVQVPQLATSHKVVIHHRRALVTRWVLLVHGGSDGAGSSRYKLLQVDFDFVLSLYLDFSLYVLFTWLMK